MTIKFKCGCWLTCERQRDGREIAGLACCAVHEKSYARLEELGPLEVERVDVVDRWLPPAPID